MSPHPMQYASLVYFNLPDEYFKEELRDRYKSRVDLLAAALTKVGFGVVQPEGAYYLFVNYRGVEQLKDLSPMDTAMYMIEKVGVAVVPGKSAFVLFYHVDSCAQVRAIYLSNPQLTYVTIIPSSRRQLLFQINRWRRLSQICCM